MSMRFSVHRVTVTGVVGALCFAVGGVLWVAPAPAGATSLPDGRVYEMVTPPENHDADVYVPRVEGAEESTTPTDYPFQAAANGDRVAYVAAPTVGGIEDQGDGGGNEYLAVRSAAGGWTQVYIQPPGKSDPFFQAFSSELTVGFLDSLTPLSPEAPAGGYDVLYSASLTGGGGYVPFFAATPPYRSATEFEAAGIYNNTDSRITGATIAYAGSSADLSHLLFEANDALTPAMEGRPAAEGGAASHYASEDNLYDVVNGRLQLVNVLPDGGTEADASFGTPSLQEGSNLDPADFSNVISADGSRVFWTDLKTGHIYMRENGTTTVQISAAGQYWTATPDGSKVFFTDGDLYEYEVESGETTDLTPGVNVQGVVGTSEDGEYVYYVTAGLGLDLWHDGATTAIATLSSNDNEMSPYGNLGCCDLSAGDWQSPGSRTAEVTPDGRSMVFMSTLSLTGYPNEGLSEVFVYDAEGGGHLWCVSCDPSGAPPADMRAGAAGFVPVGRSNTYQPRSISEDGSRVFFDSREPLVPRDTNGVQDVYEWEREGAGGCETAGGCLYLLSGGSSTAESYLLDASASGNDVFVITRAQLVSQDGNENYDVYDARVGGVEPSMASACVGSGCQGVPAAPPIFATPSSVTFSGVGNFLAPVKAPVKKARKSKKKTRPKARKTKKQRKRAGPEKVGRRERAWGKAGRS